jgi:hypothetical protein
LTKPVAATEVLGVVRKGVKPHHSEPAVVDEIGDLTLIEAQDLLDWLEAHGCTELGVRCQGEHFTVHCVCPPGYRLVKRDGAIHLLRE